MQPLENADCVEKQVEILLVSKLGTHPKEIWNLFEVSVFDEFNKSVKHKISGLKIWNMWTSNWKSLTKIKGYFNQKWNSIK